MRIKGGNNVADSLEHSRHSVNMLKCRIWVFFFFKGKERRENGREGGRKGRKRER